MTFLPGKICFKMGIIGQQKPDSYVDIFIAAMFMIVVIGKNLNIQNSENVHMVK
jgi:hypothetical protein